jgi:hypothetical protein
LYFIPGQKNNDTLLLNYETPVHSYFMDLEDFTMFFLPGIQLFLNYYNLFIENNITFLELIPYTDSALVALDEEHFLADNAVFSKNKAILQTMHFE